MFSGPINGPHIRNGINRAKGKACQSRLTKCQNFIQWSKVHGIRQDRPYNAIGMSVPRC